MRLRWVAGVQATQFRRARFERRRPRDLRARAGSGERRACDVARLVGTTPRTIRYYEEIGLIPEAPTRPSGGHRVYTQAEVERLAEVMRLKELLGVSLDELKTLLTAEEARAEVRAQLRRDDVDPQRRQQLLEEALGHIDRQLELVRHRSTELGKLERELSETRKRARRMLRELQTSTKPKPERTAVTRASAR